MTLSLNREKKELERGRKGVHSALESGGGGVKSCLSFLDKSAQLLKIISRIPVFEVEFAKTSIGKVYLRGRFPFHVVLFKENHPDS